MVYWQFQRKAGLCVNIEDTKVLGVDPPYVFFMEILIFSDFRYPFYVSTYLTDLYWRIVLGQKVHALDRVH